MKIKFKFEYELDSENMEELPFSLYDRYSKENTEYIYSYGEWKRVYEDDSRSTINVNDKDNLELLQDLNQRLKTFLEESLNEDLWDMRKEEFIDNGSITFLN